MCCLSYHSDIVDYQLKYCVLEQKWTINQEEISMILDNVCIVKS